MGGVLLSLAMPFLEKGARVLVGVVIRAYNDHEGKKAIVVESQNDAAILKGAESVEDKIAIGRQIADHTF